MKIFKKIQFVLFILPLLSVILFFPFADISYAQKLTKDQLKKNLDISNQRGLVTEDAEEERISAICKAAEPEGMDTFKKCSKDCKTVCIFEKLVDDEQCFKCEQGGDDTCKDIGLLDVPHPWCQPGGVCHSDPMMYCTPPTPAVGPHRSKLTCTSCKKRPDMCWQKVKDGTTTLTNCKLGCWNGTCEYKGKYIEKEWDGADDIIHCYECITPPPPPTCEDMGWGYDWAQDCQADCDDPDYCKEFKMTMGGPNECCDENAQDAANEGDKGDNGKGGKGGKKGPGTQTRGGNPWGPAPNPPPGSPWAPGGALDSNKPPTREDICKDVERTLQNPSSESAPTIWERENQLKKMENFQKSLEAYKNEAQRVEEQLAPHRGQVEALGRDLKTAKEAMQTAEREMKASEGTLYGYDSDKEDAYNAAKKNYSKLRSAYGQAVKGYKDRAKSLNTEVDELRHQAQKDLWQADPRAKQSESLGRTDEYFEAWHDYTRTKQRREISDEVFAKKQKELQDKIDRGGSKAEDYQRQLDNLNREKKSFDDSSDSRENALAKRINQLQNENATDGVGPYSREGLYKSLGEAAALLNGQIDKINNLKRALEKAIKNDCPPKNAKEMLKSLEGKTEGLEEMIKNLEARQQFADAGFPMTDEEKLQSAKNIAMMADSGKKFDGVKSMWDFYAEEQVNEIGRTFDPTDPSVRTKKAFWYTVGIVEGVGSAFKDLADLGIGAVDLVGETAAQYAGFEDGWIFGTDSTEALQSLFESADGNINFDGLEKLAKGVNKSIENYFTELSKAKDIDKATARAGGKIAGQFVADEITGAAFEKLGTLVRGADELAEAGKAVEKVGDAGKAADKFADAARAGEKIADLGKAEEKIEDATRMGKGLESGAGAAHAPPTGVDVEDLTAMQKLPAGTMEEGLPMQKLPEGTGVVEDGVGTQKFSQGSQVVDDTPTFIDSKSSKIPADDVPTHFTEPGAGEAPKVSKVAKANSELNFVAESGKQVELKTGNVLGSGSTSTVYVDAANPDQVIRVTDMASTEVKEAVKLDEFGREVIDDVSKTTDSVRVSEVYDSYTVQNMPDSHLNNKVVEVGENMKQGMAKDMIKKQGGKLTDKQAQALDRATRELNEKGYAWLDAKPDNYTFEQIPGTDDLRVVIVDPGGVVPMKGLDPNKARAIQKCINKPSEEFIEAYNLTNNNQIKNLAAGEEWEKIIKAHGDDIDIKALGVNSPSDVKFNPSGNVNQPKVGELFGD